MDRDQRRIPPNETAAEAMGYRPHNLLPHAVKAAGGSLWPVTRQPAIVITFLIKIYVPVASPPDRFARKIASMVARYRITATVPYSRTQNRLWLPQA